MVSNVQYIDMFLVTIYESIDKVHAKREREQIVPKLFHVL